MKRLALQLIFVQNNTNYFVRANLNSDNFEAIEISLAKWSGTNCKSDNEIDSIVNSSFVDFEVISAFFDNNDYENPVHAYLQDFNYISLISNMCHITNYKVKVNEVLEYSFKTLFYYIRITLICLTYILLWIFINLLIEKILKNNRLFY